MESAYSTAPTRLLPAKRTADAQTESRYDPMSGLWTIFAPQRGERPDEFQLLGNTAANALNCPFCAGSEAQTPPAVWAAETVDEDAPPTVREHQSDVDGDAWSVRVVPNKFPAVTSSPADYEVGPGHGKDSLFRKRPVVGGHEVVIDAPYHVESLSELDPSEVALIFAAFRDRLRHWRSDPEIKYVSVFKNVGRDAGASLHHSHSQLIATDALPAHVQQVSDRAERYRASTGCCLQCDLIRAEVKDKRRVVTQSDRLIAYCPFASPHPFMVRLTSKDHFDLFEDLPWNTIQDVARMTRRVVGWLEQIRPGVAYNLLLHTRPPGVSGEQGAFHWSLELFPRMTRMAGFEFSTHCLINPVLPELAAQQYRELAAAEDPLQTLRRHDERGISIRRSAKKRQRSR